MKYLILLVFSGAQDRADEMTWYSLHTSTFQVDTSERMSVTEALRHPWILVKMHILTHLALK